MQAMVTAGAKAGIGLSLVGSIITTGPAAYNYNSRYVNDRASVII